MTERRVNIVDRRDDSLTLTDDSCMHPVITLPASAAQRRADDRRLLLLQR